MQLFGPFLLGLLVACGTGQAHSARSAAALSPITRVVDLLKSLTAKIEHEGKTEEDLYETFVCWANKVIDTKTATNSAAEGRIDTLTTYLADLAAGRIELTSERADLEKDIEQLSADIELATDLRAKENKEYADASDEMTKAIKALESAIKVLNTATKDHKKGVLLGIKTELGEGSTAAESAALSYAVELGQKFLTKGDAMFLQRILTGDVPNPDWKKLNRPATFKKKYKARSFKIQDVLANLLETFTSNLADATTKENEAKSSFVKLMKSKGDEKGSAQDALQKMTKENGAKALSKSDAENEKKELEDQVTNDQKYIAQVKKSLADKKQEWKTRSALRSGELEAISKAISILHSDDARDLFKKSLKSQSYSFLQTSRANTRRSDAVHVLRGALRTGHSLKLSKLVMHLMAGGHFDEVIKAIDTMVLTLKSEEADDLKQKETCETDRATDTREAIVASRLMDDLTDSIVKNLGLISELKASIQDKNDQIDKINEELKEAKKIRDEENADFKAATADDTAAKKLVDDSKAVIESFYKDNKLMLAQRQRQPIVAGEAPPPPPPTWESPYGGKKEESTGIVAVLGMISEDIAKDILHAKKNEDEALKLYIETKMAFEQEIKDLLGLINADQKKKGSLSDDVKNDKDARRSKRGSLEATMKKIKGAEPGCDYFTINFPLRTKNRQIEIDGLNKAKAILSGATFDKIDPNRELKPGDALLQRARRHQH